MKKRREKGTGSISQRKNGTWTGRVYVGYQENGRPKIKAVYGKTQSEVKKKLKEVQIQLLDNVNFTKIVLDDLIEAWKETKKYQLKASSYDRLETTINNNITPYIGYYQVSSLSSADIQLYINNLVSKGYSYSTIKKAFNVINSAFKFAIERDYIRKNPCNSVTLPKQLQRSKSDIEYFSDLEVIDIVNAATSKYKTGRYKYKHGYAIIILLNTGLRVGELLALKWHNVDFDTKQIYVEETRGQIIDRSDSEKKYIMADRSTQTQSSCRYVPMNNKTEEALLYFKGLAYNNPYVMANSDHNVITYRNLFRVLSNILEANSINHGSLHTLRHTFATRLFRKGTDVKIISELLGHSDISITYNIYTHVIQEQKKKAVDILNDL